MSSALRELDRKTSSQGTFRSDPRERSPPVRLRLVTHVMGDEEDSSTPLWEPVVRGVHDPPLGQVSEIGEAREDDREVSSSLSRRRLQEPVDVLQEHESRPLRLEDPMDRPPQDALLPDDPMGLAAHLRNRIVLAREAADEKVVVGNRSGAVVGICSTIRLMSSLTSVPPPKRFS